MSASLWLGWPSQHTGPEDPEPPTCCHPTETIAVTQRTHCSRMAASSPDLSCPATGASSPLVPTVSWQEPSGWVVAQAEEERPHQQDDYNLGHRTDLHVLVPSSSHSAHWQGGLKLRFSFFSPVCPFSKMGVGWNCSVFAWNWMDRLQHCCGGGGSTSNQTDTVSGPVFIFKNR